MLRVDPHHELRRVRGLGELVERLADLHRLRADEVEGVARQLGVGQVRDVVHRLGDEVDRHDAGLAALRPGQRRPFRQRVAQLLEQLEEVVGAVDLVHLAGLRMADDDARPEDQRLCAGPARAQGARPRTSCGGRRGGAAGPRRTCPPGRRPCTGPPRRSSWCDGSARPRSSWRTRSRAGCLRCSLAPSRPRRPSCRIRLRDGRSGRCARRTRRLRGRAWRGRRQRERSVPRRRRCARSAIRPCRASRRARARRWWRRARAARPPRACR